MEIMYQRKMKYMFSRGKTWGRVSLDVMKNYYDGTTVKSKSSKCSLSNCYRPSVIRRSTYTHEWGVLFSANIIQKNSKLLVSRYVKVVFLFTWCIVRSVGTGTTIDISGGCSLWLETVSYPFRDLVWNKPKNTGGQRADTSKWVVVYIFVLLTQYLGHGPIRFPSAPLLLVCTHFSLVLFVVMFTAAPTESISSSFRPSPSYSVCLFVCLHRVWCACECAPFPAISSGSVNIFVRRRRRRPGPRQWRRRWWRGVSGLPD